MIIVNDLTQGSDDWFNAKLGVIGASRAADFASEPKLSPLPDDAEYFKVDKVHHIKIDDKTFTGTSKSDLTKQVRESLPAIYTEARNGYLADLVGQVATRQMPEQISAKAIAWGNEHEPDARALFEFETGLEVEEVGLIYKDDSKRVGVSPDGLIKGKKTGLEIKCPFSTKVFIEFACSEKIKPEYVEQCQFSMWATGYESWYFANYDPRILNKNLHYVLIERDEDFMKKYDQSYEKFIIDMDAMLKKMGLTFGEQWELL